MARRTWMASIGAIVLTILAATSAVAANLGILHRDDPSSPASVVSTTDAGTGSRGAGDEPGAGDDEPEVVHLTVRDLPPTGTGATGPASTAGGPAAGAAPTSSTGPRPTTTAPGPRPGRDARDGRRGQEHEDDDDD